MDKIQSQIEELKKQLHTMSDYDELFSKGEELEEMFAVDLERKRLLFNCLKNEEVN